MVGKQDKAPQLSIFDTPLERFINLKHELCVLSEQIDWDTRLRKSFRFIIQTLAVPQSLSVGWLVCYC